MLLLLPLLVAVGWCGTVGYEGLNGQDAHDYLRLARGWTGALHGEDRPMMVEHPHGYPLLGALLASTGLGELAALRIISALSLVICLWTMAGLLRTRDSGAAGRSPAPFVFLLLSLALSPFLLRQSITVMSDMPAIASAVIAFAQCIRWMKDRQPLRMAWMLLALAVGMSFRLAVAPVAIVLVGTAALDASGALRRSPAWLTGALLLACVMLMPIAARAMGFPVEDWSPVNLLKSAHHSDDGFLRYRLPNLLYVLLLPVHPGFLPIGLLVLPFAKRGDWAHAEVQLATLVFLAYVLFVGGMPYQNDRVLLLAQPFAAMALWPAFSRGWEWLAHRKLWRAPALIALVVLQAALCVRAILPFVQQARKERAVIALVAAERPARVYTHGLGAACSTYLPGVPVTELWHGDVERFEHASVIVARPADLGTQWRGRSPERNWTKAVGQGARIVAEHDGWAIARVE